MARVCRASLVTVLAATMAIGIGVEITGAQATAAANEVDCKGWTSKGWWWRSDGFPKVMTAAELVTCLRNHDGHLPQSILYRATFRTVLEDEKATLTRALLEAGLDPNGFSWKLTPLSGWSIAGWGGRSARLARRGTAGHLAQLRVLLDAGAYPNVTTRSVYSGKARSLLPVLEAGLHDEKPSGWERLWTGMPSEMFTDTPGQKWYPLHAAALAPLGLTTIATLLGYGADPNLTIARGQDWTALHVASYAGRPGVVSLLLKHGADATAVTTQRGWTPLHGLAWSGGRNLADTTETARILLDAGVGPAVKDARGRTAWDIILNRHGKQLQKVLDAGDATPETRRILAHLQTAAKG